MVNITILTKQDDNSQSYNGYLCTSNDKDEEPIDILFKNVRQW